MDRFGSAVNSSGFGIATICPNMNLALDRFLRMHVVAGTSTRLSRYKYSPAKVEHLSASISVLKLQLPVRMVRYWSEGALPTNLPKNSPQPNLSLIHISEPT